MPARRSILTPQFTFDNATGRYRHVASGKFVSATQVRSALDDYLDNKTTQVRDLALQLQQRTISISDWQDQMSGTIAKIHLASAAVALGGWAEFENSDLGRVGGYVKFELQHLRDFAVQIEQGLPLDGRFLNRTSQYAQAGRHTYHEVNALEMAGRGMDEERSVRHHGDSCPGCLDEEALGWQPIGTIVPPGERDCLRNCKCLIEYRVRANTIAEQTTEEGGSADEELTDYTDLLASIAEDVQRMREAGASAEDIFRAQQDKIRDADRELALIFNQKGALRFTKQGEGLKLSFTSDEMAQMKDAVFIHNHPSARGFKSKELQTKGLSFSGPDVKFASENQLAEMRVATPFQTFVIGPPSKGWDERYWREQVLPEAIKFGRRETQELRKKGRSPQEAEWLVRDPMWRYAAKRAGFRYRREND